MIWSTIFQLVLYVTAAFMSTALNIAVAVLPIRFKKLRTLSTCYLIHLSVVQIINAVFTVPVYILTRILQLAYFRAKWPGWIAYILSVAFTRMVPYSLVLLAGDKYCATNYGFKYRLWKTKTKTIATISTTWMLSFVLTFSVHGVEGLKIEVADNSTQSFANRIFRSVGRHDLAVVMSISLLLVFIFKILIWRSVRNSGRAIEKSLPTEAMRQKQRQIQTAVLKTIAYTILLYLLCALPRVFLFFIETGGKWAEFVAIFSFFLFGVVNPILYAFRHRRFRQAVALLVRDPFGRTEPGESLCPTEAIPLAHHVKKAWHSSVATDLGEVGRNCLQVCKRAEKKSDFGNTGTQTVELISVSSRISL